MAILVSGGVNSSQVKGKIGNNVFKRVNKQTVISAYQPIVRNPRTPAQLFVREKFVQVSKGSHELYAKAFKPYGVKLKGHSAYTSINRMVFNNPVVKSVGYVNGYLPKLPKDNQRLIAANTDLNGEIFNYLAFRAIRSGNNVEFALGFSIPKGLLGVDTAGTEGQKYFGTNLSLSVISIECLINGIYRITKRFELSNFEVNKRAGIDNEVKVLGGTAEDIGGFYQYTFKATAHSCLATDPKNSDNFFFALTEPFNLSDLGLTEVPTIDCYWPGVEKAERIGATMFMISTSQEVDALSGDTSETSFLSRLCMIAVNDDTTIPAGA